MKIIYARFRKNISVRCMLILLLLVAASLSAPTADAWAATFYVNSTLDLPDINPGDGVCNARISKRGTGFAGTLCTLRAAIMEANAVGSANTIILPAGTYRIVIPGVGEPLSATGDLNIRSDLTIKGVGRATTIIDGNNLDRVLSVFIGNASISGVTIRNGNAGYDIGGGIYNNDRLTLVDCSIIGNTSASGGGIFNYGTLTVINSIVSNNSALSGFGGGIDSFIDGSVTIVNSVISGNTARNAGGGINNDGMLTLTNVVVDGNFSGGGGGIYNGMGTLSFDNVTISNNSSTGGGGGIFNSGVMLVMTNSTISRNTDSSEGGGIFNSSGILTITDSTVSGNVAGFNGGGLYNAANAPTTLTNVTISENSAASEGGGIFNGGLNSILTITNATISGNSAATDGGGIFGFSSGITLMNTIIANNVSGNCGNIGGDITSDGHNLEDADTCGLNSPGDLINTNPLLGPLQNNGGPTLTHALLPGSPAIDSGDNSVCPTTDQRGVARPQDGDGNGLAICDIGAFEFTHVTYTISGRVTSSVGFLLKGLPGVTMTLSGSTTATVTTDASGNFTFTVLANGTYTVTPSMTGYTFRPTTRSVTISGASVTGQDFTATRAR